MDKAEKRALEKYPDYRGMDGGYITQRNKRMVYIKGYHQAEKDLELAWEDMSFIRLVFDAIDSSIHIGAIKISPMTKEYYQEVLKRFKEKKVE